MIPMKDSWLSSGALGSFNCLGFVETTIRCPNVKLFGGVQKSAQDC